MESEMVGTLAEAEAYARRAGFPIKLTAEFSTWTTLAVTVEEFSGLTEEGLDCSSIYRVILTSFSPVQGKPQTDPS